MAQKWNLQDIRRTSTPKGVTRVAPTQNAQQDIFYRPTKEQEVDELVDPDLGTIDVIDGNSKKKKRVFIVSFIVLIIVSFGVFINIMLAGAEVTITPNMRNITVQAEFTAVTAPKENELGYELLTLDAVDERQVKATGKQMVSLRAEGKIFVYNTKSTSPQRLIKNTRFETKDGLIFRIKESIEIPGARKDTSGAMVPGTIAADVFADATGEAYNIEPSRFTVPGLKGSDQYDSVYADSSTAFTGGFEGEKYMINEDEMSTATQELHIELRNKLLAKLEESKPAGFVLYPDSVSFSFESQPATEYTESLATIKEKAILQVPMFKEDEFASYLAQKTIPEYKGDPLDLLNPMTLSFTYTDPMTTVSNLKDKNGLTFMLKGTTKVLWSFNESELKSKLISIKKNDASEVFSKYPAISVAHVEIRPFWSSSFPKNPEKILINTLTE